MTDPNRLTRSWRDDPKKKWKTRGRRGFEIQEERAQQAIGGKATRGSGSSKRPSQKGDGVSDYIRVSAKTTEKPGAKSIRIERDWLTEIEGQARATGHTPAFTLGFSADEWHANRDDWLAFPLSVAEAMVRAVTALKNGDADEAREWADVALGGAA